MILRAQMIVVKRFRTLHICLRPGAQELRIRGTCVHRANATHGIYISIQYFLLSVEARSRIFANIVVVLRRLRVDRATHVLRFSAPQIFDLKK